VGGKRNIHGEVLNAYKFWLGILKWRRRRGRWGIILK
jgi:hypothetical protein